MKIFSSEMLLGVGTIVVIAMAGMVVSLHYSHSLGDRYAEVFTSHIDAKEQSDAMPTYTPVVADESRILSETAYENAIREFVAVYNPETLNYQAAARAYEITVDQLLTLSVPPSYADFHVEFVVAYTALADAMRAYVDEGAVRMPELINARSDMNALIASYQWLQ